MRPTTPQLCLYAKRLSLSLSLAIGLSAQAQQGNPTQAADAAAAQGKRVEQVSERIRLEDKGSVIDELRVGGQTRSIDVQPKGGMPAYQVAPTNGQRSWKILGF